MCVCVYISRPVSFRPSGRFKQFRSNAVAVITFFDTRQPRVVRRNGAHSHQPQVWPTGQAVSKIIFSTWDIRNFYIKF